MLLCGEEGRKEGGKKKRGDCVSVGVCVYEMATSIPLVINKKCSDREIFLFFYYCCCYHIY